MKGFKLADHDAMVTLSDNQENIVLQLVGVRDADGEELALWFAQGWGAGKTTTLITAATIETWWNEVCIGNVTEEEFFVAFEFPKDVMDTFRGRNKR